MLETKSSHPSFSGNAQGQSKLYLQTGLTRSLLRDPQEFSSPQMPNDMSLPRIHSHPNPYASTYSNRRDSTSTYGYGPGLRAGGVPRLLKRLFKFPQMDFEVAVWEMTNLLVAPRKVFRNMYYHVGLPPAILSTPSSFTLEKMQRS